MKPVSKDLKSKPDPLKQDQGEIRCERREDGTYVIYIPRNSPGARGMVGLHKVEIHLTETE